MSDLLHFVWEQARPDARGRMLLDAAKSEDLTYELAHGIVTLAVEHTNRNRVGDARTIIRMLWKNPALPEQFGLDLVSEQILSDGQLLEFLKGYNFSEEWAQEIWEHKDSLTDRDQRCLLENKTIQLSVRATWARETLEEYDLPFEKAYHMEVFDPKAPKRWRENAHLLREAGTVLTEYKRRRVRLVKNAAIRILREPSVAFTDKEVKRLVKEGEAHQRAWRPTPGTIATGAVGAFLKSTPKSAQKVMTQHQSYRFCVVLMEDGNIYHVPRECFEVIDDDS